MKRMVIDEFDGWGFDIHIQVRFLAKSTTTVFDMLIVFC